MRWLGDRAGFALVALALLLGVGVAWVAAERTAPSSTPASEAAVASAPQNTEQIDLSPAARADGRLGFRAQCQGCHTQGRQFFNPPTRTLVTQMATRVRQGAGEMPAFSTEQLSDETLEHILAYISTPAQPEPKPAPAPRVRGVNFQILDASGQPGEPAVVHFRIQDDAGVSIAPSEMNNLALTVAGPTTDYQWVLHEDSRRAQALADGSASYTFQEPLPADATGSAGVGLEGYLDSPNPAGGQPVREFGHNAVSFLALTDSAPVPRQMMVSIDQCNVCHGALATHGGVRNDTLLCVMCHNVANSDVDKRTAVGGPMPPQSILFRNFIHRIHTGEDLTNPFTVYGGSPTNPQPIDLTTVDPFPKDRANCLLCHQPGTYVITPAVAALSPMHVVVDGQVVRDTPPITAACTGCHDTAQAMAHAASQTTNGVESCILCHGEGRPYSVTSVHRIAQAP